MSAVPAPLTYLAVACDRSAHMYLLLSKLALDTWQRPREKSKQALTALGWQDATVNPLEEAQPGVWFRPLSDG